MIKTISAQWNGYEADDIAQIIEIAQTSEAQAKFRSHGLQVTGKVSDVTDGIITIGDDNHSIKVDLSALDPEEHTLEVSATVGGKPEWFPADADEDDWILTLDNRLAKWDSEADILRWANGQFVVSPGYHEWRVFRP